MLAAIITCSIYRLSLVHFYQNPFDCVPLVMPWLLPFSLRTTKITKSSYLLSRFLYIFNSPSLEHLILFILNIKSSLPWILWYYSGLSCFWEVIISLLCKTSSTAGTTVPLRTIFTLLRRTTYVVWCTLVAGTTLRAADQKSLALNSPMLRIYLRYYRCIFLSKCLLELNVKMSNTVFTPDLLLSPVHSQLMVLRIYLNTREKSKSNLGLLLYPCPQNPIA